MSYQLIHTSSPHLLDSGVSGYGTVARTEDMPVALYRQLAGISVLKNSTEQLQFSYRILSACGQSWHVLSCIQTAGADYSGRACHTAHHLVFSQQEVTQLLSLPQRLTPAGICLALLKTGFWVSKWEQAPQYLRSEPQLQPDAQPDATVQPTWKRHTGHKANARAFYTAPFHKESLIVIHEPMKQVEIMALLHESDWLSHTRGWGFTFTTAADESDSFAETLRIIVPADSPWIQRAARTGHPVLHISSELELPVTPPPSLALSPDSGAPGGNFVKTLARSTSHYHYTEEPDWTLFDIPVPASPVKKKLVAASVCVTCCAALAVWQGYTYTASSGRQDYAAPVSSMPQEHNPVLLLSTMLSATYDHDSTERLMQELSELHGESAEHVWLTECAHIIRQAGTAEANHAAGLKRICECARLLGVDDKALAELYIREAIYGKTPEEWQKKFDSEQVEEWLRLQLSEPVIARVFESPALQAFASRREQQTEPPPPLLATADTTPESEAEEAQPVGRVSLMPQTARCGNPIPEPLAQALTQLPLTITAGHFVVSPLQKGDSLQPSQRLELSENGYRLHISATGNNGEYRLTPSHKEGKETSLPEVIIGVRNGKLRFIRCEKGFAVLSFPVPKSENYYTNIILAPEFGIPIPEGKEISLPEAPAIDFNIEPSDIRLVGSNKPRLELIGKKAKKDFPWVTSRKLVSKHQFSINLPVLQAHNIISITQDSNSSFTCRNTRVIRETDNLSTLRCEIEHAPAIPQKLKTSFERIANAPCCGLKNAPSGTPALADLYYIISSLKNKQLASSARRKLHQGYFKLLSVPAFNAELQKILPNQKALIPTPKEASANSLRGRRVRSTISTELDKEGIQDSILTGICRMFSRSLLSVYEQEKQHFEAAGKKLPALMLRSIYQNEDGELVWEFDLQNTK